MGPLRMGSTAFSSLCSHPSLRALQIALTVTPMSSFAIHRRGVPSTKPLVTVVRPGGKRARTQFGHACSLLIFRSERPQNTHDFLTMVSSAPALSCQPALLKWTLLRGRPQRRQGEGSNRVDDPLKFLRCIVETIGIHERRPAFHVVGCFSKLARQPNRIV